MKKLLFIIAAASFILSGCVPTKETAVQIDPDFRPDTEIELDFVQLHNDTVDAFGDSMPYMFVRDLSVGGSNSPALIDVKAEAVPSADLDDAKHFAAAVIKHINDAAAIQASFVEEGSSEGFGSLWDSYSLQLVITSGSDTAKALYSLEVPAGTPIDLDPDTESFEDEWQEGKDNYNY